MTLEVAMQRFEVGRRALTWNETQLHQPARRVVDEDQQRTGRGTVFEPAMLATVDLHQLSVTLTAEPGLMECSSLLVGQPQPGFDRPLAQRLA